MRQMDALDILYASPSPPRPSPSAACSKLCRLAGSQARGTTNARAYSYAEGARYAAPRTKYCYLPCSAGASSPTTGGGAVLPTCEYEPPLTDRLRGQGRCRGVDGGTGEIDDRPCGYACPLRPGSAGAAQFYTPRPGPLAGMRGCRAGPSQGNRVPCGRRVSGWLGSSVKHEPEGSSDTLHTSTI